MNLSMTRCRNRILSTGDRRKTLMLPGAVLLMLTCCSCAVKPRTSQIDPFLRESPTHRLAASSRPLHPRSRPNVALFNKRPKRQQPAVQQASHLSQQSTEGVIRLGDLPINPAGVKQAGHQTRTGATFTPAEPRQPLRRTSYEAPPLPGSHAGSTASPGTFNSDSTRDLTHRDEYLFDGGDRAKRVRYDRFHRLGLDTEDTVGEYVDHRGKHHVKPSNRIAVYAPRFGAVRTLSNPAAGTSVDRAAGAFDLSTGAGLGTRIFSTQAAQKDRPGGLRVRSRVSGLDTDAGQANLDQTTTAGRQEKLVNVFEDLSFVKTGRFEQSDAARLLTGIQAAAVWTRNQNPVITASTSGLQELVSRFAAQQIIGSDDKHKTVGRLRIVKLADRKTAKPGDIITFTIRYDNLGDGPLRKIRIVDNLTPRLEYVHDSATSDLAGRLVVEDNQEGSLVLRFEVGETLPGHKGGIVTFKARVR